MEQTWDSQQRRDSSRLVALAASTLARATDLLIWMRDRMLHVLLFQESELSEATIGLVCLVVGLANAVCGSPWGTDTGDLWGGVAFAFFGVPQIVAAVYGGLRARHLSNMLGCFASLANVLRALDARIPVAVAFYGIVAVLCAFFILRTTVRLGLDKARRDRLRR